VAVVASAAERDRGIALTQFPAPSWCEAGARRAAGL